jgi:primosomal replication protein N
MLNSNGKPNQQGPLAQPVSMAQSALGIRRCAFGIEHSALSIEAPARALARIMKALAGYGQRQSERTRR